MEEYQEMEDDSRPRDIMFWTGVAYLAAFAAGLVLNGSTIVYVLSQYRDMLVKHSAGILILSLAICDALFTVLALYYAIAHLENDWTLIGPLSCMVMGYDVSVMHVNIWTTLAICVQRLVAVNKPMDYQTTFTNRRCVIAAVSIWLSSLVFGLPLGSSYSFMDTTNLSTYSASNATSGSDSVAPDSAQPVYECVSQFDMVQFFGYMVCVYVVDYLLPTVLISVFYLKFARVLHRTSRNMAAAANAYRLVTSPPINAQHPGGSGGNVLIVSSVHDPPDSSRASTEHKGGQKGSSSHAFLRWYTAMIALTCWLCYTPFYNSQLFIIWDGLVNDGRLIARIGTYFTYIDRVCTVLTNLNSLLNPLLYLAFKYHVHRKHRSQDRTTDPAAAAALHTPQARGNETSGGGGSRCQPGNSHPTSMVVYFAPREN